MEGLNEYTRKTQTTEIPTGENHVIEWRAWPAEGLRLGTHFWTSQI